jgi:uncharacterized protein
VLADKIRLLYTLQKVDLKLMELEEEKGDLPGVVRNLTTQMNDLKQRIDELQNAINEHTAAREKSTLDAESLSERIEKLKTQLYEVRNNKEYDAITREINQAESSITRLLQDSEMHDTKRAELDVTMQELKQQHETTGNELQSNTAELSEVSKVHETEELHLQHEREKIARQLSADDLAHYDRIRLAKDGKAVVPIKRGACGGCYKTVPPQLNLLLRKNDEIYTCENCGRILIAEEIAAEVNKVA